MKLVQSKGGDLRRAQGSGTPFGGRSLEPATSAVPILRGRAQRWERPLVYFRFSPDEFILSVAGSEETYRSTPHVAVEQRTQVVRAIGPEAHRFASQEVDVENGFRPSRGLIMSDAYLAEIAFRYTFELFIERVRRGQLPFLRWMKPNLLIHPLNMASGHLHTLEMRALYEIGGRCGVHEVTVYFGPELSDLELRTGWYVVA
jgi:hypothetical protein